MLLITGWIAALLFGLFSFAMCSVIAGGIKDSEVVVVSVFTASCVVGCAGAIGLLVASYRWALVVFFASACASIGTYALESDLRADGMAGFAIVFVAIPALVAILSLVGYLKAHRRRAGESSVPTARLHE